MKNDGTTIKFSDWTKIIAPNTDTSADAAGLAGGGNRPTVINVMLY